MTLPCVDRVESVRWCRILDRKHTSSIRIPRFEQSEHDRTDIVQAPGQCHGGRRHGVLLAHTTPFRARVRYSESIARSIEGAYSATGANNHDDSDVCKVLADGVAKRDQNKCGNRSPPAWQGWFFLVVTRSIHDSAKFLITHAELWPQLGVSPFAKRRPRHSPRHTYHVWNPFAMVCPRRYLRVRSRSAAHIQRHDGTG